MTHRDIGLGSTGEGVELEWLLDVLSCQLNVPAMATCN